MSETHLIKKYANRRLYDTVDSKHVTLDAIRDLILKGIDVEIIDDTSGADLTRSVLLQIIADREQDGRPMLETSFLTQIIRLYGNPMQDTVGSYLTKSFEALLQQQARYQEEMRKAMEASPFAVMQEVAKSNLEVWQKMQDAMLGKASDDEEEQHNE